MQVSSWCQVRKDDSSTGMMTSYEVDSIILTRFEDNSIWLTAYKNHSSVLALTECNDAGQPMIGWKVNCSC